MYAAPVFAAERVMDGENTCEAGDDFEIENRHVTATLMTLSGPKEWLSALAPTFILCLFKRVNALVMIVQIVAVAVEASVCEPQPLRKTSLCRLDERQPRLDLLVRHGAPTSARTTAGS
jgi:hypothetical protein